MPEMCALKARAESFPFIRKTFALFMNRLNDASPGPTAPEPRSPTVSILCGLAVGYPDPDFPANKLHVGREPIGGNVVFLDN